MATAAVLSRHLTPEEFLDSEHSGYELVDGVVEEIPMSWESCWLGGEIYRRLANFVVERRLGSAFPQETGIRVWPGRSNVRKPDAMFIRRDRMPAEGLGRGWAPVVPDLIVEVVSPEDRAEKLERKLRDYREARAPLVWVIYPEARVARIYRDGALAEFADDTSILDAGPVLPGFTLDLADLFAAALEQRPDEA